MEINRRIFTTDKAARADRIVFYVCAVLGTLAYALLPWGVA